MLAFILALVLSIGPYDGPPLPGAIPGTTKFAVRVSGRPGTHVRLRTLGVPEGYVASFCTTRVCAPFRVDLVLPVGGRERVELQFIESRSGAPVPRNVTVAADGARSVTTSFRVGVRRKLTEVRPL